MNKKIKAFTLAELLVTLALTSMLVTFSYLGLGYLQKLLAQFNDHRNFISGIIELKKRIDHSGSASRSISNSPENTLVFKNDSTETKIEFREDYILTMKGNVTDTFRLKHKRPVIELEPVAEGSGISLVKKLDVDIYFQKQKFHLTFKKEYDAYSKLMLETKDVNN